MTTDAFTAQIISLVRHMPDDAILALVKNQLAGVKVLTQSLAPVAKARPGRPAGSKNAPKAAAPAAAIAPKAAAPKAAPAGRKKSGPKAKAVAPVKAAPAKKAAPKAVASKAPASNASKAAPKAKPAGRRGGSGAGRQETLSLVERVVKASNGLAASDVAKAASIPQSRASAALKELKLAKRIFQGGDRRFARYAGDAKSAESASLGARKNAAGPQGKKKKK